MGIENLLKKTSKDKPSKPHQSELEDLCGCTNVASQTEPRSMKTVGGVLFCKKVATRDRGGGGVLLVTLQRNCDDIK